MKIQIKNMVCRRCVLVVSEIIKTAGINDARVQMGSVDLVQPINNEQLEQIEGELNRVGFEIINSHTIQIIEDIKSVIINNIYSQAHHNLNVNFSSIISDELHLDYNYLSSLFSSVEGITIEKYIINLKIERVKELLVYDEKTLSEIAYEMDYSSVAHLSGQFKKVTGFTPSYFKKIREQNRKSIDEI